MSTPSESGILLVGLTGTGKTNFLVALDVVLDNQVDPNGLVHSDHADDRAYLEPLRGQWLRGEELEHTSVL
jgi:signal recognition particle GTPase